MKYLNEVLSGKAELYYFLTRKFSQTINITEKGYTIAIMVASRTWYIRIIYSHSHHKLIENLSVRNVYNNLNIEETFL